ncbi:hypothetical protein J7T55_014126 [Diaporthe amygdali]|uniref:uncharacterized protein n=1 Tax=Phomopsis amygdali TaxID=1214568 RepID=UPI0022FDC035|nr:uncharacterized protein J7T55_014126 [Diaporthe amygdali]KAJ0109564.1 hypothetical protein J7T55_014126 [Diaporthe amygdali]
MTPKTDNETLLYFAFGSNLSSTQMRARCPGAAATGLAFLPGYDFIINERGYANVAPTAGDGSGGGVYGVLYRLGSPAEKRRLDQYEGVPWAYEDLVLDVELVDAAGAKSTVQALVYVDRLRVSPAAPKDEYVARMNLGIDEATAEWGLPDDYVRDVMRRYIPAPAAAATAGPDETAAAGG